AVRLEPGKQLAVFRQTLLFGQRLEVLRILAGLGLDVVDVRFVGHGRRPMNAQNNWILIIFQTRSAYDLANRLADPAHDDGNVAGHSAFGPQGITFSEPPCERTHRSRPRTPRRRPSRGSSAGRSDLPASGFLRRPW